MTRVLHLVDRVTGGVPIAVCTYIRNSPADIAHVIASPHGVDGPHRVWDGVPAEVAHLDWSMRSPLHAVAHVRRLVEAAAADVVHAHSSFPGVYARIGLSRLGPSVVYTPHCFSFERRDVSAPVRTIYRAVERALAARTSVLAACGPGEAIAAAAFCSRARSQVIIPNVTSIKPAPSRITREDGPLRIGMMGRWSAQKDPAYFISFAAQVKERLGSIVATWIGGVASDEVGDVRVTGWLSHGDVARELSALDVYVHTAAWEGFPIALLDAHALSLPILARPIDALPNLPRALTTTHGLHGLIEAFDSGTFDSWREQNIAAWTKILSGNTAEAQRDALARAWGRPGRIASPPPAEPTSGAYS
ncbi:glycosyltransferase [Microbacterium testaceum]|uniref:glycosyltransferase n=1 Tax=Microbacterium testaceum TaxID=2033 RepID=UPI002AC484E5|nr:glycosyltransferase [Microbacterium testaceum]MDZ5146127.1 glycosyltransferase [Microbacterium testaceum]